MPLLRYAEIESFAVSWPSDYYFCHSSSPQPMSDRPSGDVSCVNFANGLLGPNRAKTIIRLSTLLAASVLIAAVAKPAAAADVPLAGFAQEDNEDIDLTSIGIELKNAPEFSVVAGNVPIVFEETALSQIADHFGGTIHHQGDAGDSVSWVCYNYADDGAERTLWFLSGELGGSEKAILTVVEAADGGNIQQGCARPAHNLNKLTLGAPGLGSTRDEINEALGADIGDQPSVVLFNMSDGDEFTISKSLRYKLDGDKVTAVSITQVTTN